jgi:hypothetical protein
MCDVCFVAFEFDKIFILFSVSLYRATNNYFFSGAFLNSLKYYFVGFLVGFGVLFSMEDGILAFLVVIDFLTQFSGHKIQGKINANLFRKNLQKPNQNVSNKITQIFFFRSECSVRSGLFGFSGCGYFGFGFSGFCFS